MTPPCDLLTVETWPRILNAADSGSLHHGIQKTLETRNLYRQILVPDSVATTQVNQNQKSHVITEGAEETELFCGAQRGTGWVRVIL
jgi:hypothetical protein